MVELGEARLFALHHARHGNASPLGHDLGDVLCGHLFLEEAASTGLLRGELALAILELALEVGNFAILNLCGASEVAASRGPFGLDARFLDLLFELAHVAECVLFGLPLGFHGRGLLLQVAQLFLERGLPLERGLVLLLGECLPFDFELHHATFDFVDLLGHGVDFDA